MGEPTRRVHVNYGDGKGEWQEWPESYVRELIEQADEAKRQRAADMPDDVAAIQAMQRAHTRLKELGWRDAVYAPKDREAIEVVEPGSTGIHRAHRDSEGRFWIEGAGDLWPSSPVLFRKVEP